MEAEWQSCRPIRLDVAAHFACKFSLLSEGFRKLVALLGGPHCKDSSILGSILRSPLCMRTYHITICGRCRIRGLDQQACRGLDLAIVALVLGECWKRGGRVVRKLGSLTMIGPPTK